MALLAISFSPAAAGDTTKPKPDPTKTPTTTPTTTTTTTPAEPEKLIEEYAAVVKIIEEVQTLEKAEKDLAKELKDAMDKKKELDKKKLEASVKVKAK